MVNVIRLALIAAIASFGVLSAAHAQTFSNAFAGFGSNTSEPIQIEARELQVEDKTNSATFSGDVVVAP